MSSESQSAGCLWASQGVTRHFGAAAFLVSGYQAEENLKPATLHSREAGIQGKVGQAGVAKRKVQIQNTSWARHLVWAHRSLILVTRRGVPDQMQIHWFSDWIFNVRFSPGRDKQRGRVGFLPLSYLEVCFPSFPQTYYPLKQLSRLVVQLNKPREVSGRPPRQGCN